MDMVTRINQQQGEYLCPISTVIHSLFRNDSNPPERLRDAFSTEDQSLDNFLITEVDLGSVAIVQQECCLFIFLDGSAYYFDDFMRIRTGEYQLQPGKVNGFPHYARYLSNEMTKLL